MQNNQTTIMTVKDLAQYLKLHETSIYRMCKEKQIPAHRIGSNWRFRKDEIDHWFLEEKRF